MKNLLLIIISFSITNSNAQSNYTILNSNNTSAVLSDGGVLFNNTSQGLPGYEVPKHSNSKAIYAGSFWFAGIDQNGALRSSAPKYNQQADIFAGPISLTQDYQNSAYQNEYLSSLWTINKTDVDFHIQNYMQAGYSIPASIANWPGNGNPTIGVAHNLAPFVDVDGDNLYNPNLGDYPDVRGDVSTYIIMNDAANIHSEANGEPMNIEVHIMVYQFDTNDFLNETTFLNVRIFNRGSYIFNNFKIGFFLDADLGNSQDDYYGCLSSKNLIYTYNADDNDEASGGFNNYGVNPPCIGVVSLKESIHSAGYYNSSSNFPYNDPIGQAQIWNVLNAKWNNGTPWASNFQMDGNPYTGSGITEYGLGNPGGDRRMVMNLDSVVFLPGQTICHDFAIIYDRKSNNLESVQGVIDIADSVKTFYDNQLNFNCSQVTASLSEKDKIQFKLFPNPNNGKFTLQFDENIQDYTIEIRDLTGRIIHSKNIKDGVKTTLEIDENAGVYLLTIISKNAKYTKYFIVE